jgi:Oxysterol-binding protein.
MGLTSKLEKLKLKTTSEGEQEAPRLTASPQDGDTDDIDEVDNEGQSILYGIIAQLRPGCDLTKITLPTFILEKKSMLERITNFFQIPNLLLEANQESDDLQRFILILKWYLASWHITPKAVKKPLNPVLGEIFTCYWDNLPSQNTAYYVAEQTSHHPPKSSYFYLVPELKIKVNGVVIPKSKFLGNSSAAIMEGWGHVTLGDHEDEVYIMNQPNVYCRGILFGKLKTELGDHMYVKCSKTGLEADIDFKTKGFISGTYDAIEGVIKDSRTSKDLFSISGKWNEVMEIKDLATGTKKVLFDTKDAVLKIPKVRPLEEQDAYESRKLWKATIEGLRKRDHAIATEEKYKVENEQRILAKKRIEDGVEFHPKLFRPINENEKDLEDLEYVIYKSFELLEDAETLRSQLLDAIPILPGQKSNEKFHIPAFKK